MPTRINTDQVRTALTDGAEFALLDVRERGRYARGHLFLAINLPLSHLELHIRRFVPRMTTRVILCDGGDGLSERAAQVMEAGGYSNISIIDGGAFRCGDDGLELFRGHYATTYAFGLYVDKHYRPPTISPQVLKSRMDAGESLLVLDSRPLGDFNLASIPGAIDLPHTELARRIRDIAPDPDTQVVVNCGAITRGVLGACSLIEAGVENPVAVLDNGIRGWALAGFDFAHDANRSAGPASADATEWAVSKAQRVAERTGVQFVSSSDLEQWRRDPARTLFLVDVRTREEYEGGHLPGSIWILGGELIGLYEDHIGTLNARVCLVDDDRSRAIVTASWLMRMGWPDIAVLESGLHDQQLVSGPEPVLVPELDAAPVTLTSPAELDSEIEAGTALVIDFDTSASYERGHIPGAWWTVRSSLPSLVHRLPESQRYVATSADGRLAVLAAMDLQALTTTPVAALKDGTNGWRAAGHPLVEGMQRPLGELDDFLPEFTVRASDDRATVLASHRRLVQWHEELLEKIERDETFNFPTLPAMGASG